MRYLRLVIVFFAFFVAIGLSNASWAQAQEGQGWQYPPLDSACDIVEGVRSEIPSDENIDGYAGCYVYGVEGVAENGYLFECPPNTTFNYQYEACVYNAPSTGGHQPWREGERGHCDLENGYLCDLWQQWIELPDESGRCPEGQTLVPSYDSVQEIDTCQYLSDEDTGSEELPVPVPDEPTDISSPDVVIPDDGLMVTTLPRTGFGFGFGSGSIQHDSGMIIYLAATFVIMTFSGCALGRSLVRS